MKTNYACTQVRLFITAILFATNTFLLQTDCKAAVERQATLNHTSPQNPAISRIENEKQLFSGNPSQNEFTTRFFQNKIHSVVQLVDSIYYWNWDTLTTAYAINAYEKIIDIVYDANNNVTSEVYQTWSGSAWDNLYRDFYTYNAINSRATILEQTWNGSAWENSILNTNTYDVNNNWTGALHQTWNGSAWENVWFYSHTYDVNNNETSSLYQTWNGSSWDNVSILMFNYDVNNNMISFLYQTWNTGAWVNHTMFTYTYDVNNNRVSGLVQSWIGIWVNDQQFFDTYNANNDLTNELHQDWNGSAWVDDYFYSVTYHVNSYVSSTLSQTWNGSAWENNRKDTFIFDMSDNLVGYFIHMWVGSTWVNYLDSYMVYDANNYIVNDKNKYWNNTGTMVEYGDSIIYYYHTVVGISDLSTDAGSMSIYPNPTSNLLTVIGSPFIVEHVEIYNLPGERLFEKMFTGKSHEERMDVSQLSAGLYFVKISGKDFSVVRKFIKQ